MKVKCNIFKNGNVIVFTGLLDLIDHDDELAIVISHEMAHVIILKFLKINETI